MNDTKILNKLRKYLEQQSKIDCNVEHKDMDMFIGELIYLVDSERGLIEPVVYNLDYELPKFNPSVLDGNPSSVFKNI